MSENIVLSFALLFGATIALICAVYIFLIHINKMKEQAKIKENNNQ